jgi:MoaA/NifB/PqqE/SkfB family radical SAM enzyme/SAM-dependent methyltransferase
MESDGTPIYVRPDKPDWFVPNTAGDRVLQQLGAGARGDDAIQVERFLRRLPDEPPRAYRGRGDVLAADGLRELWLHVTNRCNLACQHCLFASAPDDATELPAERILELSGQAWSLGCRVFALTGGEPFVHPDIEAVIDGLLSRAGTRVVVLTNGLLLRRHGDALQRWPRERVHLQISIDGLADRHDQVRGPGSFDRLRKELEWLRAAGVPFTLSLCVMHNNVRDLPRVIDLAAEVGATNVHGMWYFVRGRGGPEGWVPVDEAYGQLRQAALRAEAAGMGLDNVAALRSQVFAPAGTIHDGSAAGWTSLAIGADGQLYPSPALVGVAALATEITGDLVAAWRGSAVLERIRRATAAGLTSPLRFILGGGDLDHCYLHAEQFIGCDPYESLHERTALWLIAREASRQPNDGPPRLRLKMGDVLESCGPHGPVATIHSNCLLSVASVDGRTTVRDFYAGAATNPRADIRNPVHYPEELIAHIPHEARVRSYGCGSPVVDANLQPGDVVVDLGSGTGVECFIAARLVGPGGRVIGIDMLDVMLDMARRGAEQVGRRLGYRNVDFRKGYLEALPLEDESADLVLSNCVLNLATNKRRVFAEILRVLKPGARLMISDVVCETEPDAALRNDESLRGECIAGALTQRDLFGLLEEAGFVAAYALKRFPYRVVRGHRFYSLTFQAVKPSAGETKTVMYRGPASAVVTAAGQLLPAGAMCRIADQDLTTVPGDLFELDERGEVTNISIEPCLSCACPPETRAEPTSQLVQLTTAAERHMADCMVCGAPLTYPDGERLTDCSFCGRALPANAVCANGHFVCDACHTRDELALIEQVCLATEETDLIGLMDCIRRHPSVPVHGPGHHALVPGVILSTYRNLGGRVSDELIRIGIRRGAQIAGGACGFFGACGAAAGVGIAFSLILKANPLKATERQVVQTVTLRVLERIAAFEAPRCCQRDCWLALRTAAELSAQYLPSPLRADTPLPCWQSDRNAECIAERCPLWPGQGDCRCLVVP